MWRVRQCSVLAAATAMSGAHAVRRRHDVPRQSSSNISSRRHQASLADDAASVTRDASPAVAAVAQQQQQRPPPPTTPLQQLYKSSHKGSGTRPLPTVKQAAASSSSLRTPSAAAVPVFATTRSSCAEDAGPVPERALSPLQRRQLQMRNKAAFVLTPQALRRVRYLLDQYKPRATTTTTEGVAGTTPGADTSHVRPTGIRIGVRRRGCSGYSYTVNYYFGRNDGDHKDGSAATAMPPRNGVMSDVVVQQDGVQVVVAGDALFYVIGTQMDYVVRDVEEKFVFANPNKKYSCGCEESFMPYDEDDMDD